jgi:hypothetical protein
VTEVPRAMQVSAKEHERSKHHSQKHIRNQLLSMDTVEDVRDQNRVLAQVDRGLGNLLRCIRRTTVIEVVLFLFTHAKADTAKSL